jgi:hypothetical protein
MRLELKISWAAWEAVSSDTYLKTQLVNQVRRDAEINGARLVSDDPEPFYETPRYLGGVPTYAIWKAETN